MSRIRIRKVWLAVHRWLGLTAGVLLAFTGLTGSLLVFRPTIDEQLNPAIFRRQSDDDGHRCTIDEVLEAAQASSFAQRGKISFVDFPKSEGGVWTVWFQIGSKEAPQLAKAYFDSAHAEMTGQRVHGADLMSWIYEFHVRLFAGQIGQTVVGLAGIVLLISITTGLYLWWPLWRHSWRAAFAIRRDRRFVYDAHKTTGVGSSLPLFAVAITGVCLALPAWAAPCIKLVLGATSRSASSIKSIPDDSGQMISASRAIELVNQRFPDARIRRLHLPAAPDGAYVIRFQEPGDVNHSLGSSRAWIDPYRGEILNARKRADSTRADSFLAWQLPLHNGEALGLAGRWLVLISGLVPASLYATGFLLWRRKTQRIRRSNTHTLGV